MFVGQLHVSVESTSRECVVFCNVKFCTPHASKEFAVTAY